MIYKSDFLLWKYLTSAYLLIQGNTRSNKGIRGKDNSRNKGPHQKTTRVRRKIKRYKPEYLHVHGWVVKALDPRSMGLGFDSRSAGRVKVLGKLWIHTSSVHQQMTGSLPVNRQNVRINCSRQKYWFIAKHSSCTSHHWSCVLLSQTPLN